MSATAEKPAATKKAADVPGGVMTLSRYMLDQARINKDYQVCDAARVASLLLLAGKMFFSNVCTYSSTVVCPKRRKVQPVLAM